HRALAHAPTELPRRRIQRGHDIRAPHILTDNASARSKIKLIRVRGTGAGTGLYVHVIAELDQLAYGIRRGGHARLPGIRLNGDSDSHWELLTVFAAGAGCVRGAFASRCGALQCFAFAVRCFAWCGVCRATGTRVGPGSWVGFSGLTCEGSSGGGCVP